MIARKNLFQFLLRAVSLPTTGRTQESIQGDSIKEILNKPVSVHLGRKGGKGNGEKSCLQGTTTLCIVSAEKGRDQK